MKRIFVENVGVGDLSDLIGFIEHLEQMESVEDVCDKCSEHKCSECDLFEEDKSVDISDTEIHENICKGMHEMWKYKNARYGDSFSEQFSEFGITSSIIRLSDKLNRLKTLAKNAELDDESNDESMIDTLMDLANYAIMTVMELEK